jgi:hypothetical protein
MLGQAYLVVDIDRLLSYETDCDSWRYVLDDLLSLLTK